LTISSSDYFYNYRNLMEH